MNTVRTKTTAKRTGKFPWEEGYVDEDSWDEDE
jgi:hypothetical protein